MALTTSCCFNISPPTPAAASNSSRSPKTPQVITWYVKQNQPFFLLLSHFIYAYFSTCKLCSKGYLTLIFNQLILLYIGIRRMKDHGETDVS